MQKVVIFIKKNRKSKFINLLKITSYVETSYVKQSTEKTHYFLSVIKL